MHILGGRIGIRPYVPGGYLVSNNYLKSIGTAISTGGNNGVIKNNIFEDNDIDIYLYSSFATIHNNDFYNSRIQTIDMRYTTSEIHDNSFYSTSGLFFKLLSNPPSYSNVLNDVNAINNYWGITNYFDFILDGEDSDLCPHVVITLPKRSHPVAGSGVQ
jgi:hypothetical protein